MTKPHLCACGENDPAKFTPPRKTTCTVCVRRKARNRYHNLSEDDKRSYIDRANANFKQWTKDNPLQYRYISARNRAKYNNIDFTITLDDVEHLWDNQQGLCFYTNQPMSTCNDGEMSLSLDRVDNTQGYTNNNVVLCIWRVNRMKSDMDFKEFNSLITLIYNNITD